VKVKLVFDV